MAVKLTTIGERSVRSEHPWIFADSIEKINKEGASGDVAIIFSRTKNKVIGVGLYDPDSPIRIKMLYHNGAVKLETEFFAKQINKAFELRIPLLATNTNSYRLLFGENDGFPGLIADVYDQVLVVKLYAAIWFPYLEIILKQLIEVSQVKTVVLRLSRSLQQMNNTYGLFEGQVIFGTLSNEVIPFIEHGVNFSANVIKGHKTGYFLDHRDNRKRVGVLSKNKTVLDVFSYAGGFSVHALANQAKAVTSVDISKQALALAIENGKLNSFKGTHNTLAGDAFEILRELISKKQTFDLVVIDPPSFAKSKGEIAIAKKKYRQLAELGVQLTAMGGMLVLASCSSRIVADSFFQINKEVLDHQSRPYVLQNKTQHDVDHPISFKEGAYLKTGFYRFL